MNLYYVDPELSVIINVDILPQQMTSVANGISSRTSIWATLLVFLFIVTWKCTNQNCFSICFEVITVVYIYIMQHLIELI